MKDIYIKQVNDNVYKWEDEQTLTSTIMFITTIF